MIYLNKSKNLSKLKIENFLDANGEKISQSQYEINVDMQNQKFKVTKKTFLFLKNVEFNKKYSPKN